MPATLLARAAHPLARHCVGSRAEHSRLATCPSTALLRALRARCDAGAIAIVASHRPALQEAADHVIELRDGRLLTPENVSEQAA